MSMSRKIFRPGAGQTHAKFMSAVTATDAVVRGDLVLWDTTATSSQGPTAGTFEGKTLGANDFIFVKTAAAGAGAAYGTVAGVIEGNKVGSTNTVTALAQWSVIIIQTWGVHDNIRVDDTSFVLQDAMVHDSAVAGEVGRIAAATAVSTAGQLVGFSCTSDSTYTRVASSEDKVTGFIQLFS